MAVAMWSHCVLLHAATFRDGVSSSTWLKLILRHMCSVASALSFKLPRAAFRSFLVLANVTLP